MLRNITEKIKLYETQRIPLLGGWWYKLVSKLENISIKKEKIVNPLNNKKREEYVIASMTSFPARINFVYLSVKSLMRQTYKPDRILLWLAEEQFPGKKLPAELLDLQKYGLEIKWCHDIYGHKKYYYPVKEQKENEVIITFDDDIVYPPKCIERLIKKHEQFPMCLICERAQAVNREEDKILNPGRWDTISDIGIKAPSYSLNPSPGGGCLIPYKAFYKDAVNEELIRKYAYKNDDLWYMFMCAENQTKIIKTRKYHKIFTLIEGSQVVQMATENVVNGKNQEIMKDLIRRFPEAWNRIINDSQ